MQNSLDLLAESLDMKIKVLEEIENYNRLQKESFENDNPDIGTFDKAIEKKGELIERLEKLDSGFEQLYFSLSEELKLNNGLYSDKIANIRKKIEFITELSVSVQASEKRNKQLVEQYFSKERQNIKRGRVGSKAAFDYYKNMSGMSINDAQFLDSKK